MSDHRRQIDPDTGLPAEPELPEPSVEEPDPDLRVETAEELAHDNVDRP